MPSVEVSCSETKSGVAASHAASQASTNSPSTKSSQLHDASSSASTSGSHSSVSSMQSSDINLRYTHQPSGSRASQTLDLLMVGTQFVEFHDSNPHILMDLNTLESGFKLEHRAAPEDQHIWHSNGRIPGIIADGSQSESTASSGTSESPCAINPDARE